MKEIRHAMKLQKNVYYETHLSIANCLLPRKLTEMEIKVLSRFMALEGDIAKHRFGASAKKIVRQELGLSPAGLSNYMRELGNKGFLIKSGDMIDILPLLIPEPDEQIYHLKLINIES